MQVLFKIPTFADRFYRGAKKIFETDPDPANSFFVQMAKLGHGLLSGEYSRAPKEGEDKKTWVRPLMFKSLVGRGHPEFSTGRQQDALEYLQHLLGLLERNLRSRGETNDDPSRVFSFQVEEKLQCTSSNCVSFKNFSEKMLLLPIPLDKALNKAEVAAFQAIEATKSEGISCRSLFHSRTKKNEKEKQRQFQKKFDSL